MNYDSMTVLKLKTLCKERGIRISGTKAEVIIRLMENDEGSLPAPQQISIQPMQQMQQMQPQIIQISSSRNDSAAVTFGIFTILYGIFRIGMAMFLLLWDEQVFFFESTLAWVIGISFIFAGAITTMGFRNGPILTIGVLLVSGALSILYHDEWSPLSMGLDGAFPISWSIMCSSMCILIASLPLMLPSDEMKRGWPQPIENIFGANNNSATGNTASTGSKVTLECPYCEGGFKVPTGYSGKLRCPHCKEEVIV